MSHNVQTPVQLYRYLMRCIRKLPKSVQGHYQHHVRQVLQIVRTLTQPPVFFSDQKGNIIIYFIKYVFASLVSNLTRNFNPVINIVVTLMRPIQRESNRSLINLLQIPSGFLTSIKRNELMSRTHSLSCVFVESFSSFKDFIETVCDKLNSASVGWTL